MICCLAVPSRPSATVTSVSPVRRVSSAVRLMASGFWRIRADIDSACTAKPSAAAIGTPASASAAAASPIRTSLMRRRKWPAYSPEAKRAAPPVGSVWFEPAT